jgi:ATP-dependent Zn protease
MEFAQSKGQARKDGKTGITFDDVAGMGYIATELQDIVSVSKPFRIDQCSFYIVSTSKPRSN